jgi:hypothetical protein
MMMMVMVVTMVSPMVVRVRHYRDDGYRHEGGDSDERADPA